MIDASQAALAAKLDELAQVELDELTAFVGSRSDWECGGLLIEACRCLDHAHVIQRMYQHAHAKLEPQDFDIIVRGWNVLLSLLLPRVGKFSGIPIAESTSDVRGAVMSMLHAAGRYVLHSRTADMIRHGMVTGARRQLADVGRLVVDAVTDLDVRCAVEPLGEALQPGSVVRLLRPGDLGKIEQLRLMGLAEAGHRRPSRFGVAGFPGRLQVGLRPRLQGAAPLEWAEAPLVEQGLALLRPALDIG